MIFLGLESQVSIMLHVQASGSHSASMYVLVCLVLECRCTEEIGRVRGHFGPLNGPSLLDPMGRGTVLFGLSRTRCLSRCLCE